MFDQYADGWSGAYYTWTDSGGDKIIGGMLDGSVGTAALCRDESGCNMLTVGGGTYESEVSWQLVDASGVTVIGGYAGDTWSADECENSDNGDSHASTAFQTRMPPHFTPTHPPGDDACDVAYTMVTYDIYSDGWESAMFTWTDANGVKTTVAPYYGAAESFGLCGASGGGCSSLVVSGGDDPTEISWELKEGDASGSTVASGGAGGVAYVGGDECYGTGPRSPVIGGISLPEQIPSHSNHHHDPAPAAGLLTAHHPHRPRCCDLVSALRLQRLDRIQHPWILQNY